MLNYYEVLGVNQDATPEQIKTAYRRLAKKYHPDVNDAPNAAAFFRLINEAYETLIDSNNKDRYDKESANNTDNSTSFQNNSGIYENEVRSSFKKHAIPVKIILVLLRIILAPFIPIFSFALFILKGISCIASILFKISCISSLLVAGLVLIKTGPFANYVGNRWPLIAMLIGGAALSYFLPSFLSFATEKFEKLLNDFKEYIGQLNFIFKKV